MNIIEEKIAVASQAGESQITVNLEQLLEQAKEEMNRGQRRRFERRCSLPGYYEEFVNELRDKMLVEAEERQAFGSSEMVAAMSSEGFTAETPFKIDTSKIREILDMILEYAPKIIDLVTMFLKFF